MRWNQGYKKLHSKILLHTGTLFKSQITKHLFLSKGSLVNSFFSRVKVSSDLQVNYIRCAGSRATKCFIVKRFRVVEPF